MFYSIYNPKTKQLLSTASEIDEKVIEENKLSYKTFEGDDGDWAETKVWDAKTLDFIDNPDIIVIGKTKQERIDEIAEKLNLTPKQKEDLESVI